MTYLLTVFRFELRTLFRRKGYLAVTFLVPLIAVLGFTAYKGYRDAQDEDDAPATPVTEVNEGGTRVGYMDQTPQGLFPGPESYEEVRCFPSEDEIALLNNGESSQSRARASLIQRVSSPYCLGGHLVAFESFEAGRDALEADRIDVLYVVEPDFVATGHVSQYMSELDLEAVDADQVLEDYLLRSLLRELPAAEYESLYLRLRDPGVVIEQQLSASGEVETTNEDQNFILIYGFGLLMMLGIFWGGGYLMQSVVQEKESRIIEIVLSSVSPTPLLAGKILAMGLGSLLQLVTLVSAFIYIITRAGVISDALAGIEIEAASVALMGVFVTLGFLLFGSLMAGIGALSTTVRESQNFVAVVTLPAAIPFFFLTIFAQEPNGTIATALSIFPLTAPLSMIMRLAVTDVPAGELMLSLGLLPLTVAGAIWLAGRLFRVNTLLMGTMPGLRDIPRLLRG